MYSRKLKIAQVLFSAELADEALAPAREALHALGGASALARRLSPPPEIAFYTQAPWNTLWTKDAHAALAPLITEPPTITSEVLRALANAG